MAQPKCSSCGLELGHINDACPRCLPNFHSGTPPRADDRAYLLSRIETLEKALRQIRDRVNGNESLDGCKDFYRGYNAANDSCRGIAHTALSDEGDGS